MMSNEEGFYRCKQIDLKKKFFVTKVLTFFFCVLRFTLGICKFG